MNTRMNTFFIMTTINCSGYHGSVKFISSYVAVGAVVIMSPERHDSECPNETKVGNSSPLIKHTPAILFPVSWCQCFHFPSLAFPCQNQTQMARFPAFPKPTINPLGPRPAAAFSLQNPLWREVTVEWSQYTPLKINNKHQTNVSAHFVFSPVCEYSVLVYPIIWFFSLKNKSIKKKKSQVRNAGIWMSAFGGPTG